MHRSLAWIRESTTVALLVLTFGPGFARAATAADNAASATAVWVSLLLLAPGVLGLWVAAALERRQAAKHNGGREEAGAAEANEPETEPAEGVAQSPAENRFFVAALAGTIWAATLVALAWAAPATPPWGQVFFFDPKLTFPLFVPIFGFIGALLYVLDLSRRGREDIPKGTEFGMRLIMGPYVAIVMVVLFGKDLGLVRLNSDIGQAALAFFSGLLVTLAFQGMIEKGQEVLGRWREKARYAPSEIAKRFNLSSDEDLLLRKAGLTRIVQLQERSEATLRDEVRKVGFDEHLALAFKKEIARDLLVKKIGPLARARFAKDANANSIEDIAHLNDEALDKIAKNGAGLGKQDLLALRDGAKTVVDSLRAA